MTDIEGPEDPDFPEPEDGEFDEEYTYFVGCTCEHPSDLHGWGHCEVEGCDCEGGWEE
jgi:hypothetical protein